MRTRAWPHPGIDNTAAPTEWTRCRPSHRLGLAPSIWNPHHVGRRPAHLENSHRAGASRVKRPLECGSPPMPKRGRRPRSHSRRELFPPRETRERRPLRRVVQPLLMLIVRSSPSIISSAERMATNSPNATERGQDCWIHHTLCGLRTARRDSGLEIVKN